ncbi:MAG: DMT family transporter [Anaerolineae bacterium]|nr:DMT family transporter [Anaerolineae bacterium]
MASNSLRGAIYGITAASIWGGVYVASDFVLRTIPPFTLLVIRIVIGASILAAILKASGQPLILPRRDVLRLLGVGFVGFGISLAAQFIGTKLATSVNGSVVTSASPAFILVFAALILHEPLNLTRIGAVVVASIGVLIVFDLSALDLSSTTFEGNIILVIAALTWAAYSVLVRLVSANYSTLTISFYALLGGLILALPASVIELRTEPIGEITPLVIVGILYLGVISTSLAMFLWNRAFALVEASVASLFFFAQPLVGVLLSSLLLHYPIKPQVLVGGALIIGGVLLSMQRSANQPAPQRQTAKG